MANAPFHNNCGGRIKAVYSREGTKWQRVGSLCDKCKTFSDRPLVATHGRDFAPTNPPEKVEP